MKIRTFIKLALTAPAVMFALGAIAGCGGGEEDSGEPKKLIGLSILTSGNEFFNVIAENMKDEAAKHGYEVIVVSGDKSPEKQDKQLRDFISKKVAAIVLSPCDSVAAGAPIKEANKAGIPVFTVDIKCLATDAKVVSHIATENYEGGKLAGQAMLELLAETGGEIAILDFKQAESCQLRVKGFKEIIEAHNAKGGTQIKVVAELESGGDEALGLTVAGAALNANQNLAAFFCINDPAALGAYQALQQVNKQDRVKIIGFDGQPSGKQAIKDGKIYADPIQHPDKMGRFVIQTIIKHFNGEAVPAEQLIPATLYKKEDAMADKSLN